MELHLDLGRCRDLGRDVGAVRRHVRAGHHGRTVGPALDPARRGRRRRTRIDGLVRVGRRGLSGRGVVGRLAGHKAAGRVRDRRRLHDDFRLDHDLRRGHVRFGGGALVGGGLLRDGGQRQFRVCSREHWRLLCRAAGAGRRARLRPSSWTEVAGRRNRRRLWSRRVDPVAVVVGDELTRWTDQRQQNGQDNEAVVGVDRHDRGQQVGEMPGKE